MFVDKPNTEAVRLWRKALLNMGVPVKDLALMDDKEMAELFKSKIKLIKGDH